MSNVYVDPRYLTYNKEEVQRLLDDVNNRAFFVDVTEDEYEALTAEQKNNGDLYLIREEE